MSGNMPAPRKPLVSSYFQKWKVVPGAAMVFVMETTRNSAHTYGSTLYGVRLVVSVSVGVPLGVPVRRGGGSQVHGRNSVLEDVTIRRCYFGVGVATSGDLHPLNLQRGRSDCRLPASKLACGNSAQGSSPVIENKATKGLFNSILRRQF